MAGVFPVPPTYAEPFTENPVTKVSSVNPLWLSWFLEAAAFFSAAGGSSGTIQHDLLGGLQGGAANEMFHLTNSEHANLTGGEPNFPNIDFGTYTVDGTLTVTGYITIKDHLGNSRRLMVG